MALDAKKKLIRSKQRNKYSVESVHIANHQPISILNVNWEIQILLAYR